MKTLHTVALATFAATAMWASTVPTAMAELPDMSQPPTRKSHGRTGLPRPVEA
ncbi:MAG: hypothetical protein R2857_10835 [Vampirovibrionales bacterium]